MGFGEGLQWGRLPKQPVSPGELNCVTWRSAVLPGDPQPPSGSWQLYLEAFSTISFKALKTATHRFKRGGGKGGEIRELTAIRKASRPEAPPPLRTMRVLSGSWGKKRGKKNCLSGASHPQPYLPPLGLAVKEAVAFLLELLLPLYRHCQNI